MARKTKGRPEDADIHAGQRLRVRRELLGLSRAKLAARVGLSFQQIQKYERGINRMSGGRLYQFAKVLGVPITYFFDGYEDETLQRFEGLPHDVFESREAIELLKAYFAIEHEDMRKATLSMIKKIPL